MPTALALLSNGTTEPVTFSASEVAAYDAIHKVVDGYIEIRDIPHLGLTMWMNEDGKANDLPYNHNATLLYRAADRTAYIVGNVVVTTMQQSLDLTEQGIASLRRLLNTLAAGSANPVG